VFPSSKITVNCVDEYPIKVSISAKSGSSFMKVWEGSQKKLFSKYRKDREKSIKDITAVLLDLKEDFE